jgi:hypothetical protein
MLRHPRLRASPQWAKAALEFILLTFGPFRSRGGYIDSSDPFGGMVDQAARQLADAGWGEADCSLNRGWKPIDNGPLENGIVPQSNPPDASCNDFGRSAATQRAAGTCVRFDPRAVAQWLRKM